MRSVKTAKKRKQSRRSSTAFFISRRAIRWLLVSGGSILALGWWWFFSHAALEWGKHFLDIIPVQKLVIEGRHYTPLESIEKVLNLKTGESLFAHSPLAIKQKLESIAWVKEAVTHRDVKSRSYHLILKERIPIALWQHRQKYYLIDRSGVVLSSEVPVTMRGLPIIVGNDAPQAMMDIFTLLEKYPQLQEKITAFIRVNGRRWDLKIGENLIVRLPEDTLEKALQHLHAIIQQGPLRKDIAILDLRPKGRILARLIQPQPKPTQRKK